MDSNFRYYLRVRYAECDAQKVVFNARYGDYIGLATSEFLRAIGLFQEFNNGTLGYQLVKQTVQWKAAARFDQVLEISVCVSHVGNSSFTVRSEIREAGHSAMKVLAETVNVVINEQHMQKVPISELQRALLQRGAQGVVTDHAGYLQDDFYFS